MYEHFAFMYICLPCTLLMSNEVSRGCWVPKNWNYRQLWADMWMLGMEAKSSGKAAGLINQWAVIQTPFVYYPLTESLGCSYFLIIKLCCEHWYAELPRVSAMLNFLTISFPKHSSCYIPPSQGCCIFTSALHFVSFLFRLMIFKFVL